MMGLWLSEPAYSRLPAAERPAKESPRHIGASTMRRLALLQEARRAPGPECRYQRAPQGMASYRALTELPECNTAAPHPDDHHRHRCLALPRIHSLYLDHNDHDHPSTASPPQWVAAVGAEQEETLTFLLSEAALSLAIAGPSALTQNKPKGS